MLAVGGPATTAGTQPYVCLHMQSAIRHILLIPLHSDALHSVLAHPGSVLTRSGADCKLHARFHIPNMHDAVLRPLLKDSVMQFCKPKQHMRWSISNSVQSQMNHDMMSTVS